MGVDVISSRQSRCPRSQECPIFTTAQQQASAPWQKPRGDANQVLFTALSLILLAFFILLYALSTPKEKEEQLDFAWDIRKAFSSPGGLFSGFGQDVEVGRGRQDESFHVDASVEELLDELQGYVQENEQLDNFEYVVSDEGLVVEIPGDFTFRENSARIKREAQEFLDLVFEMIARTENKVRIEGHTDNIPFANDQFDSNWELSAARATNVLRYFTSKQILEPARFSSAGYAWHQPIASNRTSAGRVKNRRVTINLIGPIRRLGGPLGTGD